MSLQTLGAETWGEKVSRARSRSGLQARDAADRVSRAVPVSHMTLLRLESLPELPSSPKKRLLAYCALVAYGFDPEDFGLSADELPVYFDPARLQAVLTTQDPSDQDIAQLLYSSGSAGQAA